MPVLAFFALFGFLSFASAKTAPSVAQEPVEAQAYDPARDPIANVAHDPASCILPSGRFVPAEPSTPLSGMELVTVRSPAGATLHFNPRSDAISFVVDGNWRAPEEAAYATESYRGACLGRDIVIDTRRANGVRDSRMVFRALGEGRLEVVSITQVAGPQGRRTTVSGVYVLRR